MNFFSLLIKKIDEKIKKIKDLSIIGHITKSRDRYLINKIGQKIELNSQGWDTFK